MKTKLAIEKEIKSLKKQEKLYKTDFPNVVLYNESKSKRKLLEWVLK